MIVVRSFAKINLGLKIGPRRADGFHELRTIYQTLALHDVVRVDVQPGAGIEIRCDDPRVPLDQPNTCYRVAERVLAAMDERNKVGLRGQEPQIPRLAPLARDDKEKESADGAAEAVPLQRKTVIEIEKRLPVQGGLGAASSNGVATMLGMERALGIALSDEERLRIAAEVGSDLPLFLVGGTVQGVGRGEDVRPLQDVPTMNLVVVTPSVGVSTPAAFARWDDLIAQGELTATGTAGTIKEFGQGVFARLSEPASGVPAIGGDRAETPLLDLVRAGIENDFERVVFPEYPDLLEVKRVLQREGARFASLSGSGSTLYGVFESGEAAQEAAAHMNAAGHSAVATTTLSREQYWQQILG